MSAISREFLMIVEESSWGTPVTTPTVWTTSTTYGLANAQAYYIRLPGDNQFTMRMRPSGKVEIPYGGGVAITAAVKVDKQACQGQLTCHLSAAQAPFLLSWAGVQQISAGTAPWTYTGVPGDLVSCSVYHGVQYFDTGAIKRLWYPGVKVDAWSIACSEASTIATLTLQLSGQKAEGNTIDSSSDPSAATFPVPADNNLPLDPFLWINTGGFVTIGGTARTAITELNINVNNVLARSWYNTSFIQYLRMTGRKTSVGSRLQFQSTPNDRQNYYQLASESMSIEFNNGTHGFTLGCNAQNVYDPFEDDLKLADTYWITQTSNNMYDSTAGSDFTLAFT